MTRPPAPRARAREAGLRIPGMSPGRLNAITDVPGVSVGHCTLWRGDGALHVGHGPVRTGCTAVIPGPGDAFRAKFAAGLHVFNGFGKPMGLNQIAELGELETPILLTNTMNVPRVGDALLDYMLRGNPEAGRDLGTINPVVLECNDGHLNDIRGRHVDADCVFEALRHASNGRVEEGVVGAGTGMRCYGHKGGIGTASRVAKIPRGAGDEELWEGEDPYVVGTLALTNFGTWEDFRVTGLPVGSMLLQPEACVPEGDGSVVIIIATDAPLDARQLGRLAHRGSLGLGRTGSVGGNGSGDFILAFSTASRIPHTPGGYRTDRPVFMDGHPGINVLFRAAVESTEEAVLNSLFVADTVVGRDKNIVPGLPVDDIVEMASSVLEGEI
ncbi:MAG: P1 family peptidase [Clostridia bacterium]